MLCCLVRGANVLGCSGNDPLKSLDLSLSLHRVVLTRHLLFAKTAVVDTVWVIEEEARFLVLAASPSMSAGENKDFTPGLSPPPPSPGAAGPGMMHNCPWPNATNENREREVGQAGLLSAAKLGVARPRCECVSVSVCLWVPFTGNGLELA